MVRPQLLLERYPREPRSHLVESLSMLLLAVLRYSHSNSDSEEQGDEVIPALERHMAQQFYDAIYVDRSETGQQQCIGFGFRDGGDGEGSDVGNGCAEIRVPRTIVASPVGDVGNIILISGKGRFAGA